jgi:Do/DeqQ family serine protease
MKAALMHPKVIHPRIGQGAGSGRDAVARRHAGLVSRLAIAVCLFWFGLARATIPWGVGNPHPTLAPMLKKVLPGVVNISTQSMVRVESNPLFNDPFFRHFFNLPQTPSESQEQSLGSGVIIDGERGYVLTNQHVIDGADKISVTLSDGRQFPAKLVGQDSEVDLAVLHIDAKGLTAVPFGDSQSLQVGDFVVAIGNPFGLGQTVTSGIVSALGRSNLGIEGPLVDLDGQLVGINTAIVARGGGNVGIGFAIPSNVVRRVADQLIRYGRVRRGQIDVQTQDLTPELARAMGLDVRHGAVVTRVPPGSPAARAGLRPGDLVVTVDGRPVRSASQLRIAIGLMGPNANVDLGVVRNGQRLDLKARTAALSRKRFDAGRYSDLLKGAVLETSDMGSAQGSDLKVSEVEQGSPAWRAGLRRGDVILSINRQPVRRPQDVAQAVRAGDNGLLLQLRRGDASLFIVIQ